MSLEKMDCQPICYNLHAEMLIHAAFGRGRLLSLRQHNHVIVAGMIRQGNEILLVQQQGPHDPAPFWALPGGRVEVGELLSEALVREVREETGLEVLEMGRLLYAAQHDSPTGYDWVANEQGARAQLFALIFEIAAWRGGLCPADPDGFIQHASFLPLADAINRLEAAPWRVMTEPLLALLRGEVDPGAAWCYRRQPDGSDQLIARLR
jgi:8-oxo-dGTP diphosphatase